jgi:hypothetical protein
MPRNLPLVSPSALVGVAIFLIKLWITASHTVVNMVPGQILFPGKKHFAALATLTMMIQHVRMQLVVPEAAHAVLERSIRQIRQNNRSEFLMYAY